MSRSCQMISNKVDSKLIDPPILCRELNFLLKIVQKYRNYF